TSTRTSSIALRIAMATEPSRRRRYLIYMGSPKPISKGQGETWPISSMGRGHLGNRRSANHHISCSLRGESCNHAERNTLLRQALNSIASSTMVAVNPSGKTYLKTEADRRNYFDAARVASM